MVVIVNAHWEHTIWDTRYYHHNRNMMNRDHDENSDEDDGIIRERAPDG